MQEDSEEGWRVVEVLPCVRPVDAAVTRRWPVWSSWIRSKSLLRARGASDSARFRETGRSRFRSDIGVRLWRHSDRHRFERPGARAAHRPAKRTNARGPASWASPWRSSLSRKAIDAATTITPPSRRVARGPSASRRSPPQPRRPACRPATSPAPRTCGGRSVRRPACRRLVPARASRSRRFASVILVAFASQLPKRNTQTVSNDVARHAVRPQPTNKLSPR